jgi:hypothetical protein
VEGFLVDVEAILPEGEERAVVNWVWGKDWANDGE